MARINYKTYPIDYIVELQQKGKREKARCFLEYFHDFQLDQVNSMSFYAKSWGKKGKGVPSKWIKEFKYEIERFFTYWQLKNEAQNFSVQNQSGRKVDEGKYQSGRKNMDQNTMTKIDEDLAVDEKQDKRGQEMDQELNTKYINNIDAQSSDCASTSGVYKKYNYSKDFEILWNLYDKKTSNKKRSQNIYEKRWKRVNISLLKAAIESYKSNTVPQYHKDFDGFLNGVVDSLIPKRAWIKDKGLNIHGGVFYDKENYFISDSGVKHEIDPLKIAKYIELGYFGYGEQNV